MNPLLGQGGNSAIESAGLLADLLKGLLDENPHPDNADFQRIFQDFQEERCPRTTGLMETTKKVQQMEILDSPILEFLQLKVFSQLGQEHLGPLLAATSNSAHTLKYLPKDYRRGVVPLEEEINVNPHDRSAIATALWMGLMLSIALFGSLLSRYLVLGPSLDPTVSAVSQGYLFVAAISISGLWTVESYRPGFLLSPLFRLVPSSFSDENELTRLAQSHSSLLLLHLGGKSCYRFTSLSTFISVEVDRSITLLHELSIHGPQKRSQWLYWFPTRPAYSTFCFLRGALKSLS
jgi:hypothetical protein